jgi:hypothetical protein
MTDLTLPRNLVEQLCKGNCVLFVGAGISMGEGGLPGGWQLAKELAQRCDYPGDDLFLPREAGCKSQVQRAWHDGGVAELVLR